MTNERARTRLALIYKARELPIRASNRCCTMEARRKRLNNGQPFDKRIAELRGRKLSLSIPLSLSFRIIYRLQGAK